MRNLLFLFAMLISINTFAQTSVKSDTIVGDLKIVFVETPDVEIKNLDGYKLKIKKKGKLILKKGRKTILKAKAKNIPETKDVFMNFVPLNSDHKHKLELFIFEGQIDALLVEYEPYKLVQYNLK